MSTSGRPPAGPVPAGRAAAELPGGDELVELRLGAPGPPKSARSSAQRQLRRGAAQLRAEHVGVGRVGDRRLDRPAEDRARVVGEVVVQRVVAGDEDDQRLLLRAPGAAGLLPQRRQRARVAGEHDRVQPGDVDAELQGVGGGDAQQLAGRQRPLQLAPLLGQVAAAVGVDPAGPGRRGRGRPAAARACSATDSALRRDRTNARVRAPRSTRSASSPAASAAADRRSGAPCSPVRSVSGGSHSAKVAPGRAGSRRRSTADDRRPTRRDGGLGRVGHGRRGQHEHRLGAVARGRSGAAGAARADVRAEHPAVGVALVDRRRRRAGAACSDHRWWAGRIPRCSMSGLVTIQRECRRTQSRSSPGVSPS